MIRQTIVELFKRNGAPPSFEMIALELGVSAADVAEALARESRLADLCGLSLQQALQLRDFYGPDVLFDESLANTMKDFLSTTDKIKRIEKKRQGGKPPQGTEQES